LGENTQASRALEEEQRNSSTAALEQEPAVNVTVALKHESIGHSAYYEADQVCLSPSVVENAGRVEKPRHDTDKTISMAGSQKDNRFSQYSLLDNETAIVVAEELNNRTGLGEHAFTVDINAVSSAPETADHYQCRYGTRAGSRQGRDRLDGQPSRKAHPHVFLDKGPSKSGKT